MRYRRNRTPGATYFFTAVTAGRRPVFRDPHAVSHLRGAFREVRAKHPFEVEAIVVLPDHLHTMWRLPEADCDYSLRWQLLKKAFTRRSGLYPSPWQNRFWEHCIRDDRDWASHLDYIHINPVKHGLVAEPWEWPWSSFRKWQRLGVYGPDWPPADLSTPNIDVRSEA